MTAETCTCSFDSYVYMSIRHLIDKFSLCEWLHPNTVTAFGMLLLIPLVYAMKNNKPAIVFMIILLRAYLDCLDGELARRCKKQSKLGGILDLINDNLGQSIIFTSILLLLFPRLKAEFMLVMTIMFIIVNLSASTIVDVSTHKTDSLLMRMGIENSFFFSLLMFIGWLLMQKCR